MFLGILTIFCTKCFSNTLVYVDIVVLIGPLDNWNKFSNCFGVIEFIKI